MLQELVHEKCETFKDKHRNVFYMYGTIHLKIVGCVFCRHLSDSCVQQVAHPINATAQVNKTAILVLIKKQELTALKIICINKSASSL